MSITNKALAEKLHDSGIRVTLGKDQLEATKRPTLQIEATAFSMSSFVSNPEDFKNAHSCNAGRFNGVLVEGDGDEDWVGGSFQYLKDSLNGGVNMKPFTAARAKLEKTGLVDRIEERARALRPVRKRKRSEDSGDFEYDRRWDDKPCVSRERIQGMGRSIQIICNLGANCSVDSASLNRYGNIVWAVADILEASGIATEIVGRYPVVNCDSDCTTDMVALVTIKKTNEYVPPSTIAAICQTVFFRRVIFGLICTAADLIGHRVHSALGRSPQSETLKLEDGRLTMSPNVVCMADSQLENKILELVDRIMA